MTVVKNALRKLFALLGIHGPDATPFSHFYQHAELYPANWISLAVNKKIIAESFLTKELEILSASDAYSLKIAETANGFQCQLWKNNQSLGKLILPLQSLLIKKYNLLIDSLLEKKVGHFQKMLSHSITTKVFQPTEISQEDKALEWIKASFGLLEKAILQSFTDPELMFQVMLFLGENPKTNTEEIRLIIFNLDTQFTFLKNGNLRVRIYNDKDADFGSSKKAAMEGDFNFRKREMLDELTKLISVISSGLKIIS
jgi:hypothetical protein